MHRPPGSSIRSRRRRRVRSDVDAINRRLACQPAGTGAGVRGAFRTVSHGCTCTRRAHFSYSAAIRAARSEWVLAKAVFSERCSFEVEQLPLHGDIHTSSSDRHGRHGCPRAPRTWGSGGPVAAVKADSSMGVIGWRHLCPIGSLRRLPKLKISESVKLLGGQEQGTLVVSTFITFRTHSARSRLARSGEAGNVPTRVRGPRRCHGIR
jgi:hypothetical protein